MIISWYSDVEALRHTILDLFCEPKVHKLDMTFGINENVLWLQIPICDAFDIMQELQNQDYLSSIEACDILLKLMGPS